MLVFHYCSRDKDSQRCRFVADRAVNIRLNWPVNHTGGIGDISIMASAIWTDVDAVIEGYAIVEGYAVVVQVIIVVVCIVRIIAGLVL